METENENIREGVGNIEAELARLNSNRFMRMHDSIALMLWVQFLKGLALGLGTVVGATILVSATVVILSNIDFIPTIGDWASQIADQMKDNR